jgi:hypothetical protein
MKNYSRAYNRWKAKCKFEKRIRLWIPSNQTQYFFNEDKRLVKMSCEDLRNKVRKGESYCFLRWTSTPCSCGSCAYLKYNRTPKSKINKQIWDDIQDDLAS